MAYLVLTKYRERRSSRLGWMWLIALSHWNVCLQNTDRLPQILALRKLPNRDTHLYALVSKWLSVALKSRQSRKLSWLMPCAMPYWMPAVDRHADGPITHENGPALIFLFFNFLHFSKQASIRIRGTSST